MRETNTAGMADQINTLVSDITDQLDSKFPPRPTNNKPQFPLIIVYGGENALKAHPYILETFTNVWRSRSKAVYYLVYRDGDFLKVGSDSDSVEELEYGIGQAMDELQERDDCFADMTNLLICTIESAEDCAGAEEFQKVHEVLMEQIEETETDNYKMIRFVMLDETNRGRRKSREIREFIKNNVGDEQKEKIVLYSNRLRNSVLVNKSPVNYHLVGSSILIANASDGNRGTGLSVFFQGGDPYVMTASYSRVRRPNKAIVETILMTAIGWLKKNQQTGTVLSRNDLCGRLQLSAGRMDIIDRFYENHVEGMLPPQEILEYFPRRNKQTKRMTKISFDAFQEETFGIYDNFISGMVVFDKNTMDLFRREFKKMLAEKISNSEAASSLTDSNIEDVLSEIQIGEALSGKTAAGEYMREQMKQFYMQKVCGICRDEMRQYGRNAKAHETMLDSIIMEFQNNMDANAGETVKQFYEELTEKFLSGGAGRELLENYRSCEGQTQKLFEALRRFVDALFTSEIVFSLPLEGELEKRLGEKDENYQVILQNELMNNIESKVRLKTLLSIHARNKTIMANRYENGSKETEISSFLKGLLNLDAGDTFFDTGNRNLIETIVFYTVDIRDL